MDTSLLVRREEVQTSTSVLPIRANGDRPAFHVVGANGSYNSADAPWDAIAAATHLHLGGPEFMGGEEAAKILAHARENGTTTSADILAPGEQAAQIVDWIAPALAHLDYLLPNDDQVLGLSGEDDLQDGCRALLERGVGCVVATRGPDGAVTWTPTGRSRCRLSRWRWWTPPAAATPSRRAFCAACHWAARAPTRPRSGARPRRWWRRGWAQTTGTSTSRPRTPSRPRAPWSSNRPQTSSVSQSQPLATVSQRFMASARSISASTSGSFR